MKNFRNHLMLALLAISIAAGVVQCVLENT
jgi:hypothetical protein